MLAVTACFLAVAALMAVASTSALGEPGQEPSTRIANQALMALQECNLADGDGVNFSVAEDRIEVVIGDAGRVVLIKDPQGTARGFLTKAAGGDPVERLIHLISEGKPGPYCDEIYETATIQSADVDLFFDEARSLEFEISFEEVLRFHADLITAEMSFSNLAIRAQWFGCDENALAIWVQSVLGRVEPSLDPCAGREVSKDQQRDAGS